ncbi:long-chain-alcohol o-fatty-acyltransferase [Quercus suber]|uniref:Long-chain-alcohol o-fatty-acyltransferase n=1 Tax=Quercus suber TaxID=58331 RepID=A0AAW0J0Q2_QUESU
MDHGHHISLLLLLNSCKDPKRNDKAPLPPPHLLPLHHAPFLPSIKLKQDPPLYTKNNKNPSHKNTPKSHYHTKVPRSILLVIKALFLAMIIRGYDNRPNLHPYVILTLYCCHIYLVVKIVLALAATPVQAIFGFEIEPQFNEPYLATSLQDFWSHRWNLIVTNILQLTIYILVCHFFAHLIGPHWDALPAIFSAFLMSDLSNEVTWFFVLHGMCTVIEVVVKKTVTDKCLLHGAISGPLTVRFVIFQGH